jgi:hypothetical protein
MDTTTTDIPKWKKWRLKNKELYNEKQNIYAKKYYKNHRMERILYKRNYDFKKNPYVKDPVFTIDEFLQQFEGEDFEDD